MESCLEFLLLFFSLCVYHQQTTKDEIRTVCSSLKQLESEAAYKLQVLACGGDAECGDSLGPASAVLHFTTQTNRKLSLPNNNKKKKIGRSYCVGRIPLGEGMRVGCQSAMISPDGRLDQDTLQLAILNENGFSFYIYKTIHFVCSMRPSYLNSYELLVPRRRFFFYKIPLLRNDVTI